MSDIFISYARKDIEFAGRIVDALAKNNLDAWIDWKSIPKGEDWEQEIYHGIEEADAFIFLISPASVKSEMCNKEIKRAVENSKRVIPVVVHDSDLKNFLIEVSKNEISRRNWIFCRDGQDDFDKAIEEIRKTIHTDYEWLKFHTEFQVKALKWEKYKDASRLLRGKELREAEEKLSSVGSQKDPLPTDIQRRYLFSSRRSEETQKRRLTIGLSIGLLAVTLLAIFALWQLKISEARRIAALARANLRAESSFLEASIALQSLRVAKTDEGFLALSESLSYPLSKGSILLGNVKYVHDISWSPTDELAAANSDGTVFIWNIEHKQISKTLDYHKGDVADVEWSKLGQLASGGIDGRVIIWDLFANKPNAIFNVGKVVLDLAWSPNESMLAVSTTPGIQIWDIKSKKRLQTVSGSAQSFFDVIWLDDNTLVFGGTEEIIWWDLTEQRVDRVINIERGWGTNIALTPDSSIAVTNGNSSVTIFDAQNGAQLRSFLSTEEGNRNISFSNKGNLASSLGNDVVVWDPVTQKMVQTLTGHTDSVTSTAWSLSQMLASSGNDGLIIVWDLSSGSSLMVLEGHDDLVAKIDWSNSGILASGSNDGEILLWNENIDTPITRLKEHEDRITSLAWSPSNQLASASSDGTVILWTPDFERPAFKFNKHTDVVTSLAWSKEGVLASGSLDGSIIIWDAAFGRVSKVLHSPNGEVQSLVWIDNDKLASGGWKEIFLWNVDTEKIELTLEDRYNEWIFSLDWSGNRLASGGSDGILTIWKLEGKKPVYVKAHSGWGIDAKWAPSGDTLASISNDQWLSIWDVSDNKPTEYLKAKLDSGAISVSWSTDGALAYTNDNNIYIIPANRTGEPCDWLPRNLTINEWKDYVGGISAYQPTCPNLPYGEFEYSQQDFELPSDILISTRGRSHVIMATVSLLIFITLGWFLLRHFFLK